MLIYKATNKINKKSYIGLTKEDIPTRRAAHYRDAKNGSEFPFHRALRVHNKHSWEWEIIDECETKQEASDLEIKYIAEHNTFKNGYNGNTGGLREFTQKRSIKDIDNLIEVGILDIGAKNPNPPITEEHKSKISLTKLEYFASKEGIAERQHRSEKMKEFWASEEGQKRKEEHRQKCGRPQSEAKKQADRERMKNIWAKKGAKAFNR